MVLRLHYPTSFRYTVVFSLLWTVTLLYTQLREQSQVLAHASLAPGVGPLCQALHIAAGGLLLLPRPLVDSLSTRCAADPSFLVLLSHLMGFWFAVWHAYTTELYLKQAFLKSRGALVYELQLHSQLLMALGCVLVSFTSAVTVHMLLTQPLELSDALVQSLSAVE